MQQNPPTLHMICGKIASGKSTLTRNLGAAPGTVAISEDDWLNALFADEMKSLGDYVRCTRKLREIMAPHVTALLDAGVSVVLDFQANTVEARNWMRGMLEQTDASHVLHVLDVPDEVCLARLHARNAQGNHPFAVSDEQYWHISNYFVAPSPDENFDIVLHH
ncbi:AAA family ATPase [Oceaniglobus trochenteri]|uniref:AAA family ATPase n=1 Tax=Oceaniglobus trochenteri TaxID=2763260 RepID=UPI001CFF8119|nr:ATP-binding protein [Oceaniglobus trochenteri]